MQTQTMPRPSSENTFQVAFKIPEAWLAMADAVAGALSRPGVVMTRTDALRAVMARGFEAIAKEKSLYTVSAWNGYKTTRLFGMSQDKDEAVACAKQLASTHAGGMWTVFQVFQSDKKEPVARVQVPAPSPKSAK